MKIELTPEEIRLKYFMGICAVVYFIVGFIFLLLQNFLLDSINYFAKILNLKQIPLSVEKFWLSLAFSMMMTIALLSYIAYINIRKNKNYIIPILASKLASSLSSLVLFFGAKYFAYLLIFLVDGSIFVITLILYIQANEAFLKKQIDYLREKSQDLYQKYQTQEEATVASVKDQDKFKALDKVLELTGFFEILERTFKASKKKKEDFLIAIKPNFMFLYSKKDISTYTDPQLVEYLVDKIYERGFRNIAVVEAQSTYGNYYKNREVRKVATYIGYSEKNYRIVDLTQEMIVYYYGGRLKKHWVGKTWKEADFRISFAKNKTHIFCYYTLTLKNVYGTLPCQNKLKEYHTKREYDWVTIEALKHFKVHYGLIDAYTSADGNFGVMTDRTPNFTMTIIGGDNLIAVDWVGAKKMGLEPIKSRFLYCAIKEFGFPKIKWLGDKSVYEPWENVNEFFIESLDIIEEHYAFSDWWFSVLTTMDDYFPFKRRALLVLFLRKILFPFKKLLFRYAKV